VIVDLGKITGIVPQTEQIFREQYRPGARLRFLVLSVAMGVRGPEIILSRSNNKMVETVFKQEIPEIADGSVEIKGIARDAGNRSKVSVFTSEDGIDPIGSCIGQRGSRITTIIDELGGEKIDIIQYSTDAVEYIKHALSPAKVASVTLDDATKEASATVAPDQFSLAIGRGGQNVRLAAALTGWKIKVVEQGNEDMVVSSDDNTVPEEIADETKNDEAASTENKEE
jgi:N utilization substance protein A